MSLQVVSRSKPKKTFGVGWKIYIISGRQLKPLAYNLSGMSWPRGEVIPRGKWLKARGKRIYRNWSNGSYPAGFHVYLDRETAEHALAAGRTYEAHRVVRVQFRGAHTIGQQSQQDPRRSCVVCKQIKILQVERKRCPRSK